MLLCLRRTHASVEQSTSSVAKTMRLACFLQDISIDVYGREKKEGVDVSGAQPAAAVAEEPAAEPEEEEDDLEALLMA